MLYRLLRSIATVALRWYYSSIEVLGLEQFPSAGPVIVAANHWNALIDALIIACALDRPVRLTAKATLLAQPLTRLIAQAVGIIPLRRVSDEQYSGSAPATDPVTPPTASAAYLCEDRNTQSFGAILDALQGGEVVLIFPEGRSHSEPALARLKTGCARLALLTHIERRMPPVPIVPIGLTFEAKERPRSSVVVQVGPPLLPEKSENLSPEHVQLLTARLDSALRDITLNFATQDVAERVRRVSAMLTTLLDHVRPLESPDAPFSTSMRMAQRLEAARQELPGASPETRLEVNAFLERLDDLCARLRVLRIPVNDLLMPVTLWSGAWFVLREVAIATATLPIATWGRLNHWIPLSLARGIGRTSSTNADEPAMRTLVAGLVTVLLFYVAVATFMGWSVGTLWAFAYVVTLPPTASLDFWLTARLRRAAARARAYLTLRADPGRRADLRREAAALRHSARRLDAMVR